MPINATMLCTDFNRNFSPKLDGGDENGLAKRCDLGKYSQRALEQLKRGHTVNYSKGCSISLLLFFQVTKIHRMGYTFFLLGLYLDHSCQPWWEKETNSSQQTHDDEHPKEDPVNDHCNVLPVFLHLGIQRLKVHY